jgi:hypothetical protein
MSRSNSNLTADPASEESSVISSTASSRRGVRGVIGLARKSKLGSDSGGLVYDPNEIVDGGYLVPQGVYKGAITYKEKIVRQLMVSLKNERNVAGDCPRARSSARQRWIGLGHGFDDG